MMNTAFLFVVAVVIGVSTDPAMAADEEPVLSVSWEYCIVKSSVLYVYE